MSSDANDGQVPVLLGGIMISHPDDIAFVRSMPEEAVPALEQLIIRQQSPLRQMLSSHDIERSKRVHRQKYPDYRMIPLADTTKAIPKNTISHQAVWNWA
ncbi:MULTISPECIES: hypothetical protein [unclassified Bradyrhizobium]|uniref:hypothetical protein n=1 Tax=unclassified Bradyrhizobium TaxID=2631580 RepID=UPI001BA8CB66|nr:MULTISPECIES: hypothetical protein [unclassified Bradyrhizobium]MBR1208766.1 hypothetical protein [Bradyrhizobium sp. AUGA SZCCT0124]MBR1316959.1 hypothetical protein [Bradyrhizobium sp. AUGA SZCCT0051]MBR1345245.1 hypothetical protein [Bradyrhizobium sp. AUGA SZCCT0105]MBR1360053.1 hypothetical protein [Bradyrhizobium sp. AUGA SZCCT0045]